MHVTSTQGSRRDRFNAKADRASDGLRGLIRANQGLCFLVEARDAPSAALAERCGFKGLWASRLSISSSLEYRDANEACWIELANTVNRLAEATGIPILVGADSGLDNFNNARLVARQLYQRGAGGICLEDHGAANINCSVDDQPPLADIEEFCGRLKAIKDTVPAANFVLVAGIEASIAGHGQQEALARAHAYADAGADTILIQSRRYEADGIFAFTRSWQNRLPVVTVPTRHHRTPTARFREAGISTVIWANHHMGAAIAALHEACTRNIRDEGIPDMAPQAATLEQLFDRTVYDELAAIEGRCPAAAPIASRRQRHGACDVRNTDEERSG
jgi:phosphoenolpyruvate phosphomutase